MFSKKQRLNKELFDNVFKLGKTQKTEYFLVKQIENNMDYSRFAISVPKKNVKGAVKRHLLKRRFSHALKNVNLVGQGRDFVFVLNSQIQNIKQADLINFLKDFFKS